MRLVFFGSGDFGIPALEALAKAHDVVAAVSQPDRPAGRGGRIRSTPLRRRAEELGLSVLTPETPNTPEFAAQMAALKPDLAVVIAYGHLIKKPLLAVPSRGFVNLHASLLPAYRGAAPVPWAILNGESVSGVSVFQLDERFDSGAVIARLEEPILPDDTSGTYLERIAGLGAGVMAEAVAAVGAGAATPQPQDGSRASSAPRLAREDGRIDWALPFDVLERKVRAFQPWPQAFATFATSRGAVRVNIHRLTLPGPLSCSGLPPPGTVLAADAGTGLVVMTGDAPARLSRIQPEGKKPMSDTEFLRGTSIEK